MSVRVDNAIQFTCPGCTRVVVAGWVNGDPTVVHPEPVCETFDALEPDELLALANKQKIGRSEGFDA